MINFIIGTICFTVVISVLVAVLRFIFGRHFGISRVYGLITNKTATNYDSNNWLNSFLKWLFLKSGKGDKNLIFLPAWIEALNTHASTLSVSVYKTSNIF